MSDTSKLVTDINNKVRKLISIQNSLKEQDSELKNKQEELKQIIEKQNKVIEQLKDKNRNLKIAKSVKQAEGNSDVKIRINELVREIDQCIEILNK